MKQVIALHIQTSMIHLCCNVVLRCHRPGSLRESRVLCGSIEGQIIGEVTRVALKMQSWLDQCKLCNFISSHDVAAKLEHSTGRSGLRNKQF